MTIKHRDEKVVQISNEKKGLYKEIRSLKAKMESLTELKNKYNSDVKNLENALRAEKSLVKDQKKAINLEKNEIQRQKQTFSHKESMFQSQIRKNELTIQTLKDKISDLNQKFNCKNFHKIQLFLTLFREKYRDGAGQYLRTQGNLYYVR